MRKTVNLAIVLTLAYLTLMVSGCGKSGDDVVAVINGYEVTSTEFNDYYNRIRKPVPSAEDEYNLKRDLLDSVIVSRLLVQAAYEKNIDKSTEIARIILNNKNKFLMDILFMKDIAPYIEPTEAEIKDHYNKLEFKYRASHILVIDYDTALSLLERIKVGENFEQLAFDYSIDPSAKRNRGDMGYFAWGKVVDAFQEAVVKLEPGEISTPVETSYGFHLIKMVDKLPNDGRASYDAMKEYISEQIKGKKAAKVTEDFMAKLRETFPITVDETTCEYLLFKREKMYPPQILQTLPRNDFDVNSLDRDEKELIIASMEGHQISVAEYFEQLRNVPAQYRPDLDDFESIGDLIFEVKKEDILALEAVRKGYDNDKDYLEKMRLFKEMNMAEIMKSDSLPKPTTPDETEVRDYYDQHSNEFMIPATVQVYEILLSDEILATNLAKSIRSLRSFKNKASDLTERPGFKSKNGDLGQFSRSRYPEIFDLAYKTPIGGVGGPIVTNQKYSIFYVVDRTAEQLKDYLGVKKNIVEKIVGQSHGNVFKLWIDEKKSSSSIDINDEAIWATIDRAQYEPSEPAQN